MADKELDAYARSQGYKNYATMQAFLAKERERITSRSAEGEGNVLGQPIQQTVNQGLSLHPKMLLQYVLDKWNKATGGQ